MPRFVGTISPRALTHLVEHDPIPHCIIDLRTSDEAASLPLSDTESYKAVTAVMDIGKFAHCLKDADAWATAHPSGPSYPTTDQLLVFVTPRQECRDQAAATAAEMNFQRCLSLQAMGEESADSSYSPSYINRDACAYLLSLQQQQSAPQPFMFVDLRRHDECAMYGSIPGSTHIPVETFIFAMQMDPPAFEAACRTPMPPKDQLLILQCRSNRRSGWAALIAEELGFKRVLVYKQGSYGWRVDPGVKAYASYELSDPPPQPEEVPIETVDGNAAVAELNALGIGTH